MNPEQIKIIITAKRSQPLIACHLEFFYKPLWVLHTIAKNELVLKALIPPDDLIGADKLFPEARFGSIKGPLKLGALRTG